MMQKISYKLSLLMLCAWPSLQAYGADVYPSKPIKLIVTFVPGGGADILARYLAQALTTSLGKPVLVDNKPGAGGLIGIQAGLSAPADGYTLTLISSSYTVNPSLYKLKFDPVNDMTPILAQMGSDTNSPSPLCRQSGIDGVRFDIDRIRVSGVAGLSQSGDMVDIDAEQHGHSWVRFSGGSDAFR